MHFVRTNLQLERICATEFEALVAVAFVELEG